MIRLLEGDTIPGKTFLNRLHGYMEEQKAANGSRFSADHYSLMAQFVSLLEDTGPGGRAGALLGAPGGRF